MPTNEEIIANAKSAVIELDEEAAAEVAKEALDAGISPLELIDHGFAAGMNEIGSKFESGELYLPHLIAASEAMTAGLDVLAPEIERMGAKTENCGKVVLGTIEGDIHSIGKDIVATMLKIAGFEVIDLGRDVAIAKYIEAAKEHNADVVASSALMTTTMVLQMQVEEQLKEAGLRNSVLTMVGGAPVTQDWADKIGADIYGENANDALVKLKAAFE